MIEEGRNDRFSILYEHTIDHFITIPHVVIGCGAIGGPIIRTLGQIGIKELVLWDHDTVETVNIGPQGFAPENVGIDKSFIRAEEFLKLSPDSDCDDHNTRFKKLSDHPSKAYWWLCVDSLRVREFIFETALEYDPHKMIDMRMGGLNYEIYNMLGKNPEEYKKTIQFARDNPVQEGCTSRSTPHTAMLAASIGINMALTKNPPYSVLGNMMDYNQEIRW